MKVVILHPPLYPIDHKFFNILGKHVDLVVYNFGEYPRLHKNWTSNKFRNENTSYKMKIFGKGPLSFKTQVNPSMLVHLIKDQPDVVISVAFWIPSFYASIMRNILGFKFLIKTDAISATDDNISKIKKFIRKIICKNTDIVISASPLTTQYLKSLCKNISIRQSLQTIDVDDWNHEINKLPDKTILRDELNLQKDKIILLGVGGFTEKKNWDVVFKHMKQLDNCQFILIGEGSLEEKYQSEIKKRGLIDRITIISRKEGVDLIKYFKASDIFIFPSLFDQFGYVVPEALASRLPVICTEYAGASSLIKNGYNGYVIDPNKCFLREIKIIITNFEQFQKNAFLSIKKLTLENKVNEFLTILGAIDDD